MRFAWSARTFVLWAAVAVCLAGLATTLVLGFGYVADRRQRRDEARAFASRQAEAVQRTIDAELRDQMAVAGELAAALSSGAVGPDGILPAIREALDKKPNLFGLTAAFQPFAADPKQRLFAPYYRKDDTGAFVLTRIESQDRLHRSGPARGGLVHHPRRQRPARVGQALRQGLGRHGDPARRSLLPPRPKDRHARSGRGRGCRPLGQPHAAALLPVPRPGRGGLRGHGHRHRRDHLPPQAGADRQDLLPGGQHAQRRRPQGGRAAGPGRR